MTSIHLKPGRERPILRKHPWIFASAIKTCQGDPGLGETVDVFSDSGNWLARAAYSPHSSIRARIWTWQRANDIDEAYLEKRLQQALHRRLIFAEDERVNAYREVNAESDGLPGLIVDRYADFRVVQFLSAGAEKWKQVIVQALSSMGDRIGIYERSDVEVRELEGLEPSLGPLSGEHPPEALEIREYGLRFLVDIVHGQKTGFYLDQRENRRIFQEILPTGGEILDCFAYTGGFTLASLAAGAEKVLSIDSSASSLELAAQNLALNGYATDASSFMDADVFSALRLLRDQGRSFDAVILDPPKFAPTPAQVSKASRGYKDINLYAFKLLRPGGLLFTFSCSGGVSPDLFQKIVADAALDAGREAVVTHWLSQPPDHPIALCFPEGRYLKGLVCQVEE